MLPGLYPFVIKQFLLYFFPILYLLQSLCLIPQLPNFSGGPCGKKKIEKFCWSSYAACIQNHVGMQQNSLI